MKSLPTSFLRIACSLFILSLVATGCTTVRIYPGPQLQSEKIAKLRSTFHGYFFFFFACGITCEIIGIDGEIVPCGEAPFSSMQTIELLPGKHEVTLDLESWLALPFASHTFNSLVGKAQTLSFVAEAGHVYKADGDSHGEKCRYWIIDQKTGQVVAGEKP